jgi:hypothetical protein
VTFGSSVDEGSLAFFVGQVWIRSQFKKKFCHLEVAGVSRHHQHGVLVVVSLINVRSGFYKRFSNFIVMKFECE